MSAKIILRYFFLQNLRLTIVTIATVDDQKGEIMMFGMRIALLRAGNGWSQAELARRIGVSASAVGMYEQGRREPSLDLVVRLANEFGVTTDYLLIGLQVCPDLAIGLQNSALTVRTESIIRLLSQATK